MHTCHAKRCGKPVPPEMLMCRRHWFMVPLKLRRAVWREYRDGQCNLDPLPSKAWHAAADAAIKAVAEKEGIVMERREPKRKIVVVRRKSS
jgi:hypothetical protein